MNICYLIWLLLIPSLISLVLLIIAMYSESWLISGSKMLPTSGKNNVQNLDIQIEFTNSTRQEVSQAKRITKKLPQYSPNSDVIFNSEIVYSIPHVQYESLFGLCVNYETIKFNYENVFEKYIEKMMNNETKSRISREYKCEDLSPTWFKKNFLYCHTINGKNYLLENTESNQEHNYINCKPICDPLYNYYCPQTSRLVEKSQKKCITNSCINECFLAYYTALALYNSQYTYKLIITKFQLNTCITSCFKIINDCSRTISQNENEIKQVSFSGLLFNTYTNQKLPNSCQNGRSAAADTGIKQTMRSSIINNNANNNEILYDDINKCQYYKYNLFNVLSDLFVSDLNSEASKMISDQRPISPIKYLNLLSSSNASKHLASLQYHNLNDIFYSVIITLLFLTIFFHIITIFLLPLLFLCSRNSTCLLFVIITHIIFMAITFVFNFSSIALFFINSMIKNEILYSYSSTTTTTMGTTKQITDSIAKKLLFDLKLNSINLFINHEVYGYAFYLACFSIVFTFSNFIIACVNLYYFKRKIYDNLSYGSYDVTNAKTVKYFSYL